ncbi:MAG: hypothetical protein HZC12_08680 [Nitrospirae bacterium]|nr:hypothetical protein [Nitrospirota bacterium]
MLRSYFLLNVILIALAGFLSFKLYDSLAKPLDIPFKAIQKQAQSDKSDKKEAESPEEKKGASDFQVIVQKDLFRPSRTEPKIEEISKAGPPLPPPRLIGTVITESVAKAYLEDPITKTVKAYGIKDSIAGFIVQEIGKNNAVLLRGEEKIEVKITRVETVKKPDGSPSTPPVIPPRSPHLPQPVQPTTQTPYLPAQPPPLPTPPASAPQQ